MHLNGGADDLLGDLINSLRLRVSAVHFFLGASELSLLFDL